MASLIVRGGRIEIKARAMRVFPAPGLPVISTLCPPAAATSRTRLTCFLSAYDAEINRIFRYKFGVYGCTGILRQPSCAAQMRRQIFEALHRHNPHSVDERRLGGIFLRHEDLPDTTLVRYGDHWQDAIGVAYCTIEPQFANEDCIARIALDLF
jgi:hypothetical protein